MFRLKNVFFTLIKVRNFSQTNIRTQIARPSFKIKSDKNDIGPVGWFLFLIPVSTFGLGTWQIQRKKWKENLIAEMQSRSSSLPVELPEDLDKLSGMEYLPVHVRGHFVHEKELYMGPRSLLKGGDASSESGLMSKGQNRTTGFLVITPFKLADRDLTILVNRGWVSQKNRNPITRPTGQVNEEMDIVGIVRLNEIRPNFIPKNSPEKNSWFYRDLDEMCKRTESEPVFLDIVTECDVPGGPIGGQTRVTLRNEHMSYIITWYSLCGITSLMWYRQFIKKLPLL